MIVLRMMCRNVFQHVAAVGIDLSVMWLTAHQKVVLDDCLGRLSWIFGQDPCTIRALDLIY